MENKDEGHLTVEAKMYAPLVWKSSSNCKIQDLQEAQYDEALHLIKRHFFREEPMCKASGLCQDCESVVDYLDRIKIWIKDTTSIVALSLSSNRVIGVAVTRINSDSDKLDTYNRVQILKGTALKKIMHLIDTLIKETKSYEKFGHDSYLRIHVLCVHPSYQDKGIEVALLRSCIQLAESLKAPAVGGVFTSGSSQSFAASIGFQLMSEIRYSTWVVDDLVVFDDPGRGNYTAAFMGILLPNTCQFDENTEISNISA